jgi:hypothetical protein
MIEKEKESLEMCREARAYMLFSIVLVSIENRHGCHGRVQDRKVRPDPQCHHVRLNAGTATARAEMTKGHEKDHW